MKKTDIQALILRGKNKGKVVKVSQWCNDWFTIMDSGDIYSPTSLAFVRKDMKRIKEHNNNGMLFRWYHEEFNHDLALWIFKKYGRN